MFIPNKKIVIYLEKYERHDFHTSSKWLLQKQYRPSKMLFFLIIRLINTNFMFKIIYLLKNTPIRYINIIKCKDFENSLFSKSYVRLLS